MERWPLRLYDARMVNGWREAAPRRSRRRSKGDAALIGLRPTAHFVSVQLYWEVVVSSVQAYKASTRRRSTDRLLGCPRLGSALPILPRPPSALSHKFWTSSFQTHTERKGQAARQEASLAATAITRVKISWQFLGTYPEASGSIARHSFEPMPHSNSRI
ncbi:hypothetical protein BC826DRAFT_1143827 [Russula brevipes]|nr:hypothetical protein BC826DRAFT_1143827 [Russula brevipes]